MGEWVLWHCMRRARRKRQWAVSETPLHAHMTQPVALLPSPTDYARCCHRINVFLRVVKAEPVAASVKPCSPAAPQHTEHFLVSSAPAHSGSAHAFTAKYSGTLSMDDDLFGGDNLLGVSTTAMPAFP